MNADAMFYLARGSGAEAKTDLVGLRWTGEKPSAVTLVEDVRSVELSGNGEKMLVRKGDALHVLDARPVKVAELATSKVDLAGWSFSIDVRQDWRRRTGIAGVSDSGVQVPDSMIVRLSLCCAAPLRALLLAVAHNDGCGLAFIWPAPSSA